MIATKSYIDTNGQVIVDGQPLQFVRRPQNLKAAPSRHRKQPDEKILMWSIKKAAASLMFWLVYFTALAWLVSIVS